MPLFDVVIGFCDCGLRFVVFLGGPPPIPPEFCAPFSKVLNVLCCRTLVGLMNSLIRRATTVQPRAVTDLLVQQVSSWLWMFFIVDYSCWLQAVRPSGAPGLKSRGRGFKSRSGYLLVVFFGRSYLDAWATFVNSQLVCLPHVGVCNHVMFDLNFLFLKFNSSAQLSLFLLVPSSLLGE